MKDKELWKRDYAILRQGDERYKRQLGRVMILTVERAYDDREKWQCHTSDSGHCAIRLVRKFDTKEDAMRAIEKKAAQLLKEALAEIIPFRKVGGK